MANGRCRSLQELLPTGDGLQRCPRHVSSRNKPIHLARCVRAWGSGQAALGPASAEEDGRETMRAANVRREATYLVRQHNLGIYFLRCWLHSCCRNPLLMLKPSTHNQIAPSLSLQKSLCGNKHETDRKSARLCALSQEHLILRTCPGISHKSSGILNGVFAPSAAQKIHLFLFRLDDVSIYHRLIVENLEKIPLTARNRIVLSIVDANLPISRAWPASHRELFSFSLG